MERRRREETLSKRQRMVATCKEKGCELRTEMQKIFGSLSIFVVEVWTRPMACITLVIAAPPHSLAYAREKNKQRNKINTVSFSGFNSMIQLLNKIHNC